MDSSEHLKTLQASVEGFFPGLLGLRLISASPEKVVAELEARDDLRTVPGITHGGAIMGLADALGGMATSLNLRDGQGTTTIESKTNFFAAARTGTTITAECVPLHRGRRTMVWQTSVRDAAGRLCALVTQTQMVLEGEPGPREALQALFRGKSDGEQKALLAELERGGAAIYRALAERETDPQARHALLASAKREEENAAALEAQG